MRYFLVVTMLMSGLLSAQSAEQPGIQYANYTMLLVPQQGEGMLIAIDKLQKIVFVPIPSIAKSIKEDGVSPVRYGDLLQLVRQLAEENQRLKAENDHLWKVAENRPGVSTSVIVQQPAAPAPPDPDAERRQARMMLLRSLLSPQRSTVNVNVTDCTRFPALCVNH